MKTKVLILGSSLVLVTLLLTILIDAPRDTREHDLKVTRQSASADEVTPAMVESNVSSPDDDLGTNVTRVAVTMVKTDKRRLRELRHDWLIGDDFTDFGGSDLSDQTNSKEAEPQR